MLTVTVVSLFAYNDNMLIIAKLDNILNKNSIFLIMKVEDEWQVLL